jgi:Ca2+-binding RTX toxin-like protein
MTVRNEFSWQGGIFDMTTYTGTSGADSLHGSSGSDVIYGLAGNDTLYGEAGSDTVYGGDGNDILFGGGSTAGGTVTYAGQTYMTDNAADSLFRRGWRRRDPGRHLGHC